MIPNITFLLALVFVPLANRAFCQDRLDTYAIHRVNIIDVKNHQLIQNQTVLIENGIIASIINSDRYTENDSIQGFDYTGYFLTPGLIDAHVHLGTNPSAGDNLAITQERLHYLLKNGITTVRDMAGDARYLSYLSRQASLDEMPSPDIHFSALLAGESFFKDPRTRAAAQGLPPGSAPWMRAITAESDIDPIISEAKGTGATGIKIYANLDAQDIQKIVQAAHAQKMKVWAHSSVFPAKPSQVCQAEVDVISHSTYIAWEGEKDIPATANNRHRKHEDFNIKDSCYQNVIDIMDRKQTILDATLAVYQRYFPDSSLYQYGVSLTKLAYSNHIKIGVGTDLPIRDLVGTAPILREMLALQNDVGMKPIDVLKAATIINAEMIGEEHSIGSIEPGKKAHLLILKKNPMLDILHVKHPEVVIKNGRMIKSN